MNHELIDPLPKTRFPELIVEHDQYPMDLSDVHHLPDYRVLSLVMFWRHPTLKCPCCNDNETLVADVWAQILN